MVYATEHARRGGRRLNTSFLCMGVLWCVGAFICGDVHAFAKKLRVKGRRGRHSKFGDQAKFVLTYVKSTINVKGV